MSALEIHSTYLLTY